MKYLITGGTGFIGNKIIERLITQQETDIIALVRNKKSAMQRLSDYGSQVSYIETSLENVLENESLLNTSFDYIIHCAAPTQSSYMISNPIETIDTIVLGTKNILELARRCNVKGMVYLSSMEVFGYVTDIERPRTEVELGEIDLTSPRSCYPLGKRLAEHYCHLYQKEYDVPVKIARLAQVFGTGVRPEDNRVFMQFAKAVLNKEDIILKTDGTSMGNYCSTEDAINAILTILYKGQDGEVYNVVNEANTMTIREMAELVIKAFGSNGMKVIVQKEGNAKTGYAPKTGLRMSGEKLRELGWVPTKGLVKMYSDILYTLRNAIL